MCAWLYVYVCSLLHLTKDTHKTKIIRRRRVRRKAKMKSDKRCIIKKGARHLLHRINEMRIDVKKITIPLKWVAKIQKYEKSMQRMNVNNSSAVFHTRA